MQALPPLASRGGAGMPQHWQRVSPEKAVALAAQVAKALGRPLEFMSYAQQTPEGKAMRDWIVKEIEPLDREKMRASARKARMRPLPAQEGERS